MENIRGSARSGAPVNRSGASAPAPTPPPVEPAHSRPAPAPAPKKKSKRLLLLIVAAVVALGLIGLVAAYFLRGNTDSGPGIDRDKYQAVFFVNGQVYFGKLQSLNDDHMRLTDIFYLQAQAGEAAETDSKNPQQTTSDQANVQLIKLGQEVHGPEDEMIISRDQLLLYENLKPDSKVVQTIQDYKKQ